MSDIDDQIKRIEGRIGQLEADLREAKRKLHDLRLAKAGIAGGDFVQNRRGELLRVARTETHSWGVWVWGNPRKKDGTFGTAIRFLASDWTKVGIEGSP